MIVTLVIFVKFPLTIQIIACIIGNEPSLHVCFYPSSIDFSRNCGDCVCENCSPHKRPVPERDWLTPVRVCNRCDDALNESNKERK